MGAGLATIVFTIVAIVGYRSATVGACVGLAAAANRVKLRVEPKGVEPSTS